VSGGVRLIEGLRFSVGGPRAAAWLVWKHRYQFRLAGGIDLFLPRGSRPPPWLTWALATFRKRPRWDVRTLSSPQGSTFMIRWLAARRWQVDGRSALWVPGRVEVARA
jgi:hypothetical protein